MAARAASLISGAAGKTGKPRARLTAAYFLPRRVLFRIADSVEDSPSGQTPPPPPPRCVPVRAWDVMQVRTGRQRAQKSTCWPGGESRGGKAAPCGARRGGTPRGGGRRTRPAPCAPGRGAGEKAVQTASATFASPL